MANISLKTFICQFCENEGDVYKIDSEPEWTGIPVAQMVPYFAVFAGKTEVCAGLLTKTETEDSIDLYECKLNLNDRTIPDEFRQSTIGKIAKVISEEVDKKNQDWKSKKMVVGIHVGSLGIKEAIFQVIFGNENEKKQNTHNLNQDFIFKKKGDELVAWTKDYAKTLTFAISDLSDGTYLENVAILIEGEGDDNFNQGLKKDITRLQKLFRNEDVSNAVPVSAKQFTKESLKQFCKLVCDLYPKVVFYYTGHGSAGETPYPQFLVNGNNPVCLSTDIFDVYSQNPENVVVVGADACNVCCFFTIEDYIVNLKEFNRISWRGPETKAI